MMTTPVPPNLYDEEIQDTLKDLVRKCGGDPDSFEGDLIRQQMESSLKLIVDGHETGQIKVITRSLKEMRYAYRVFNKYAGKSRVSIFGSARTPEDHPDYKAAREFSIGMAENGWMCITGAAEGIMKAGLEGIKPELSFGLAIRLPFESSANACIEGDPKHITFRYFFTRKLMFLSHSEALVAAPGGFGTMDEIYEALTLMQTGKATIIPVVLLQGEGRTYWNEWNTYVKEHLLGNKLISEEDLHLYYLASSPQDAINHILHFYKRYHSSRYVKDMLVMRIKKALTPDQLAELNATFHGLVVSGKIEQQEAFAEEQDAIELPRLVFHHTRYHFGRVRQMIDWLNNLPE